MNPYILVGVGGALGATLRFAVNEWIGTPNATIAVNAIGSLLLGVILSSMSSELMSKDVSIFLGTGILGAFTTMSAFSIETIEMVSKDYMSGFAYFGTTVILCPLLALAGWKFVEFIA